MHAFGPLSTLFHDAEQPRASDAEIAWYLDRIPADAGLVLEPMCGSGRLLVPLVVRERKVHGVDLSAAMLASCEARLAREILTAALFRQDVTQMNVPFRYGCAYISGGSFQLITDPAAAKGTLERVRAHLVAPGLLILDCHAPSESLQRLGAALVEVRTVKLVDGTQITLRSETTFWADARLSRAELRYAHRRGSQRLAEEHETVTFTWYPPDELAALVGDAGFRDVEIVPSARDEQDRQTFCVTARL